MKSQPLLLITLIISHMLVNVVWASTHKGIDWQDTDNMPHLHFSVHSDHADTDGNDHHPDDTDHTASLDGEEHKHHQHAHVCLVCHVSTLFSMASTQIQNACPENPGWPSSTSSLQPPVPPPLA